MGLGKNLKEFFWSVVDEKRTVRHAAAQAHGAEADALHATLAEVLSQKDSAAKYEALDKLKENASEAISRINAHLAKEEDKAFVFSPFVWLGAPLMFAAVVGLAMSSLPVTLAGFAGMGAFSLGMSGRENTEANARLDADNTERYEKMLADAATVQAKLEKAGLRPEVKQAPVPLRLGAAMPDGTIYAGTDPATGGRLFMMPQDAGVKNIFHDTLLKVEFSSAAHAPRSYNSGHAYGHNDWLLPSREQMEAATGNLKGTDLLPAAYYWTSTELSSSNAVMAFTGDKFSSYNDNKGSTGQVRLMRVEPPKHA